MTPPMSPAGSKTQKPNPKSQKSKVVSDRGGGIVPQPSREPLPMKPRRGLFITLMTVFVVWVGVMLAMYVTTVRPRRHSAPPSQQSPTTTMTAMTAMTMTQPGSPADARAATARLRS